MVIKTVEELAQKPGFKILKFANRRGKPIYDASLNAGVDYDQNLAPPGAPDAEHEEEDELEANESEDSESNESDSEDTGEEHLLSVCPRTDEVSCILSSTKLLSIVDKTLKIVVAS